MMMVAQLLGNMLTTTELHNGVNFTVCELQSSQAVREEEAEMTGVLVTFVKETWRTGGSGDSRLVSRGVSFPGKLSPVLPLPGGPSPGSCSCHTRGGSCLLS